MTTIALRSGHLHMQEMTGATFGAIVETDLGDHVAGPRTEVSRPILTAIAGRGSDCAEGVMES